VADIFDPRAVIRERGVPSLLEAAEREYQHMAANDHQHVLALPFGNPIAAPFYLYNLSFLIAGLQLGRTMRVLDFGAGSCWLSRHLNEMGCATISLDPSPTALEMGRRLFREYPPIGGCVAEPVFLQFDGHTIELEDESVERIVCNDAFHHVPNPEEVIHELFRVLKPGGIVGFSEAGRQHSRSPTAQLEMRLHHVLENDILLEEIWAWARAAGFTDIVVKPAFSPLTNLSYDDYQAIVGGWPELLRRPRRGWSLLKRHFGLLGTVTERTAFMLHKGPPVTDSRVSFAALGGSPYLPHARDLSHEMRADQTRYTVRPGEPVQVRVHIRNTGTIRWLHANLNEFAMVKVGGHLHDENMAETVHDFLRANLAHDVSPGQATTVALSFAIDRPGVYNVVLDLVSERVAWFAQAGSEPVRLEVVVAD
jgi:ubiquinone/menaquinone biosynthesis C-methylase UbiE